MDEPPITGALADLLELEVRMARRLSDAAAAARRLVGEATAEAEDGRRGVAEELEQTRATLRVRLESEIQHGIAEVEQRTARLHLIDDTAIGELARAVLGDILTGPTWTPVRLGKDSKP